MRWMGRPRGDKVVKLKGGISPRTGLSLGDASQAFGDEMRQGLSQAPPNSEEEKPNRGNLQEPFVPNEAVESDP